MCGCLNPHLPTQPGLAAVGLTGRLTPDLISWFCPGPTSCSCLFSSRRKSHSLPSWPSRMGPTSPSSQCLHLPESDRYAVADNLEVPESV